MRFNQYVDAFCWRGAIHKTMSLVYHIYGLRMILNDR